MSERILAIHECVVINKIFIARIIRRIDVDYINLAGMGICQSGECLKVITFDENVIRGIWIFANDSSFFDFCQDRKFISESLFNSLRLVFPDKTIFFMSFQQLNKSRFLFIAKTFNTMNLTNQFLFINAHYVWCYYLLLVNPAKVPHNIDNSCQLPKCNQIICLFVGAIFA